MNYRSHKKVLSDLKCLLEKLDKKSLTKKNPLLSKASIGEHFRHIIEFYQCCISQKQSGIINYDLRIRNKALEENIDLGIVTLTTLIEFLRELTPQDDCPIILNKGDANAERGDEVAKSFYFRELNYCLDHCIHHQSLIKIGLIDQNLDHLIDENFGVAFSTQNYRNKCAS